MQYLGGKHRIGRTLASYMNLYCVNRPYFEPFIGGANVILHIASYERHAADINSALVTMWQTVCNGWKPPDDVSEEEYLRIKRGARNPYDPLTAFAGFGCSFGGKWFAGYARNAKSYNYASQTKRNIARKLERLKGVTWHYGGYDEHDYPPNCVIYCDPPYANTTSYNAAGTFDHDKFYNWCRLMAAKGHLLFISEYQMPDDFKSVLEIPHKLSVRSKLGHEKRMERLFKIGN